MLRFSTKLYVKESLTNKNFIEMVIKWASDSPNYSFKNISWNGQEEFVVESETKNQKLTILNYDETVMVHLTNIDKKIIWTNDYVLTTRNFKRILSVQLYSDTEDVSIKLPTSFNRPRLLKTIIKDGYGDSDKDLPIDDNCLIISNENLDIIKKIILDEEEYTMPLVYVTPSEKSTTAYPFDYNELAKDLAGVAHVLVAENNDITYKLRDLTKDRNPYNSAVQIYFCKGVSQRILPTFFNDGEAFRKEVASSVFRRLILSKIDDDLSWSKIHINKVKENNAKFEKYSEELIDLYDAELKSKDADLEIRNIRIQELEDEVQKYKTKTLILEQRIKNESSTNVNSSSILLVSEEYNFYEDEQKDVILNILKKEYETMNLDPNQKETRKYHIIKSILQQNSQSETLNEIIQNIRRVFSGDFKMTTTNRKAIRGLGFSIEEKNHFKLIYQEDERYHFTMSKTSSDNSRATKNLRSEILKTLFSINN